MKREETVDYNIKIAWHAISRMYNQQAVKEDLTTSIGFVLLNIDTEKGAQATKIAPLMGLEARSLTRMLKSMEDRGLIYRQQDPNDGRSVRIYLTTLGKAKREVSRRVVKRFDKTVKERIPDQKLQVFFEVVHEILEMIEAKNIYEEP